MLEACSRRARPVIRRSGMRPVPQIRRRRFEEQASVVMGCRSEAVSCTSAPQLAPQSTMLINPPLAFKVNNSSGSHI
jgi:hypothetical protein